MLKHRIKLGSVADSLDLFGPGETPDVVYTDPPWGPGNLKYWRTKAVQAGSKPPEPDWGVFLDGLAFAISAVLRGPVFIEMGERWAGDVADVMRAGGVDYSGRHVMDYGRPARPQVLLGFNGADVSDLPRDCWEATAEIVRRTAVPGGLLYDPCLGLGKSAEMFADAGMTVVGTEINRDRFRRAADRLGVALC